MTWEELLKDTNGAISKTETIEDFTLRIQEEIKEAVEKLNESPEPEDKNLANEGDTIQRTLSKLLNWLEKKEKRMKSEKELVSLGWKARQVK